MNDLQELSFTFRCMIDRPVDEVFEAIAERAAISTFFTDDASAGLVRRQERHRECLRSMLGLDTFLKSRLEYDVDLKRFYDDSEG